MAKMRPKLEVQKRLEEIINNVTMGTTDEDEVKGKVVQHAEHIARAVIFVDFIARFPTNIVYCSYKSSHLALPIFVIAKSCLCKNLVK